MKKISLIISLTLLLSCGAYASDKDSIPTVFMNETVLDLKLINQNGMPLNYNKYELGEYLFVKLFERFNVEGYDKIALIYTLDNQIYTLDNQRVNDTIVIVSLKKLTRLAEDLTIDIAITDALANKNYINKQNLIIRAKVDESGVIEVKTTKKLKNSKTVDLFRLLINLTVEGVT